MDKHTLIKQQLPELLAFQNRVNFEMAENWAFQGYPWYRSVLVLCAGVIGQADDKHRVKLHLVEIFSKLLTENMEACIKKGTPIANNPGALEFLAGSYSRSFQGNSSEVFSRRLDEFMGACASGHIPVHKFWGLCACVGLEWPELRLMFLEHIGINSEKSHAA